MPTNNLKHIGQIINTQRRCVVVFREIPDDIENCLVVDSDALPDWMHDDVMQAVESPAAQASANFYEYATRNIMSDGTTMLNRLHNNGLLRKQPTKNISMVPNRETSINLAELNKIIRQENGDAPAVTETTETTEQPAQAEQSNDVMDDSAVAQTMLDQANLFEQEAKALREKAYEMSPELAPKKRTRKVKATA